MRAATRSGSPQRGWQVTGVDFSEVGIEKARQLEDARTACTSTGSSPTCSTTSPRRSAFELVIVFYLQVPGDERTPILRAAAQAVAPGGIFLLVGHDSSNIEHGYGGPQDPAVLYTAEDVADDLDGSGLQIERAETVERPVETPDGRRIALDALVRASRPQDPPA